MENGQWWAVATLGKVVGVQTLAIGTLAQKVRLIALTRALELSQGKNINMYTDSKYAFMVVHAHGTIWKERGLLTSGNKNIKHEKGILKLLVAVNQPNWIAIMLYPEHLSREKWVPNQPGTPNCQ